MSIEKVSGIFSPEELVALIAISERVMRDVLPGGKIDVAYCFGEMPENTSPVLKQAASLYKRGIASSIAVPEQHGYGNPPNSALWSKALQKLGVPNRNIIPIVGDVFENPNTYSESQCLARDAVRNGWQIVSIIAEPFHQLRAYLTLASHCMDMRMDQVRIYNATPDATDWMETVPHSNGRTVATRANMIFIELERIGTYDNIRRPLELLAALDIRDCLTTAQ